MILIRTAETKIRGAVMNGIYNISEIIPEFHCPTGNCKWAEFSTLALTSSCKNVTSETKIECNEFPRGDPQLECNYTTPSGLSTSVAPHRTKLNFATAFRNQYTKDPSWTGSRELEFVTVKIWRFEEPDPRLPELVECDIRWCARRFLNVTVVNGTFQAGVYEDFEVSRSFEGSGWSGDFDWWNYTVRDNYSTASFPGDRTFMVTDNYRSSLTDGVIESLTYQSPNQSKNRRNPHFANSTNIAETVALISKSMTNEFSHDPDATEEVGQAITPEQYIFINWRWIALDLLVEGLGIALLVCTMVVTNRRRIPAWKSSGIMPLLTLMDGWDNRELLTGSRWELEKRSDGMRGCLEQGREGVQHFKRADA